MRCKKALLKSTMVLAALAVTLLIASASAAAQTESVLHNFINNNSDSFDPVGGLILDAAGNLYGTGGYGGPHGYSGGTVFKLIPQVGGGWTEKILHSFGNGLDGANPWSALIFDGAGNLYGTTYFGGASSPQCNPNGTFSCGTAFQLSPVAGGGWKETILHSFGHNASDGRFPYAGMIFDAAGNLYGTAQFGGTSNAGMV